MKVGDIFFRSYTMTSYQVKLTPNRALGQVITEVRPILHICFICSNYLTVDQVNLILNDGIIIITVISVAHKIYIDHTYAARCG